MSCTTPSLCDIVREEAPRGKGGTGNNLATHVDLTFQTRYSPANWFADRDTQSGILASLYGSDQDLRRQLAARYGPNPPPLSWPQYTRCLIDSNNHETGYFDRDLLAAYGYAPQPILALPTRIDPDTGKVVPGYLQQAITAIVPEAVADQVPLGLDRIAEPHSMVLLIAFLVIAYFAVILLLVYAQKRAIKKGVRREAAHEAAV